MAKVAPLRTDTDGLGLGMMSTDIGTQLPDNLFDQLSNANPPEQSCKAIPICTVDGDGWAHPALLSYGEVEVKNRSTLRVVTFNGTKTTANLRMNGRLTILFVDDTMTYYVKGTAHEVPGPQADEGLGYAYMDVMIAHILSDAPGAGEEGAIITSGIIFKW